VQNDSRAEHAMIWHETDFIIAITSLHGVFKAMNGRVRLVLHGTNDFDASLTQACVKAGVTKVNVNKLVLDCWHDNLRSNAMRPLTELMDTGIDVLTKEIERWMDIVGSSGKASSHVS
jgi:fructose-bisphosphate aldolase class II